MKSLKPSQEEELCHREAFYAELRQSYARRFKAFDPRAAQLLHDLVQTFAVVEARMTSLVQRSGVTLAGLNVLTILRGHGTAGCPLNTLSRLLLVSRANITGLVDGLAQKRLVQRQPHTNDRRVVLASLTNEGHKWLDAFMPAYCQEVSSLSGGLSNADKGQIVRLLTKLRHTSVIPKNSGPQKR